MSEFSTKIARDLLQNRNLTRQTNHCEHPQGALRPPGSPLSKKLIDSQLSSAPHATTLFSWGIFSLTGSASSSTTFYTKTSDTSLPRGTFLLNHTMSPLQKTCLFSVLTTTARVLDVHRSEGSGYPLPKSG